VFPALSHRDRVRPLITVLTASVMAFATSLAVSAPAQAGPIGTKCPADGSRVNGGGAGTLKITTHLKNAPYAGCDNVDQLYYGTAIYYWCTHINKYGNKWVWGRVSNTSVMGWTSMANLDTFDNIGVVDCGPLTGVLDPWA